MMYYLTRADLVAINKKVLYGENQSFNGIQDSQGIDVVVAQPQMKIFGKELYPTIWQKAAFIMQKITKKHLFADGNKRTALLATLVFLDKNGYILVMEDEEKKQLLLDVTMASDSKEKMIEVANILEQNCKNKNGF